VAIDGAEPLLIGSETRSTLRVTGIGNQQRIIPLFFLSAVPDHYPPALLRL
jgi:hypothetical protein